MASDKAVGQRTGPFCHRTTVRSFVGRATKLFENAAVQPTVHIQCGTLHSWKDKRSQPRTRRRLSKREELNLLTICGEPREKLIVDDILWQPKPDNALVIQWIVFNEWYSMVFIYTPKQKQQLNSELLSEVTISNGPFANFRLVTNSERYPADSIHQRLKCPLLDGHQLIKLNEYFTPFHLQWVR